MADKNLLTLVKQKHKLGCGSASLAMIMGISYDSALSLVHPNRVKYKRVSTSRDRLVSILENHGYRCEVIDFSYLGAEEKRQKLMSDNRCGILCVWMEPYRPWRHAVGWDGERVYDPSGDIEGHIENLVWGIKVG